MKSSRILNYIFLALLLSVLASCSQFTPENLEPQPNISLEGTGLSASYYGEADFSGPEVKQIDREIHFDWGQVAPARGLLPGQFSAVWQGELVVAESKDYQFFLEHNGIASLSIGGNNLRSKEFISLIAGKRYPLVLEFQKTSDTAKIKLEWAAAGMKRSTIPQSNLYSGIEGMTSLRTLAVDAGTNLLLNPSFEGGEGAWISYGNGNTAIATQDTNGEKVYEASFFAWIQQNLPVSDIAVGQTYTFSAKAKASLQTSPCSIAVAGGNATQVGRSFEEKLEFSTTDWQSDTVSFTMPTGTVWLAVYMATGAEACQFDDVSLTMGEDVPELPADSLLQNGDFDKNLNYWLDFGGNSSLADSQNNTGNALNQNSYAWLQQIVPTTLLDANVSYELSAYGKASGASCRVGFAAGTATKVLIREELRFNSQDWMQDKLSFTIPEGLEFAVVFLASGADDCLLDNVALLPEGLDPVDPVDPVDPEVCAGLAQEAETGNLFGAFKVFESDTASGSKYIATPDGNEEPFLLDSLITPDRDHGANFCVNIPEAGQYSVKLWVAGFDDSDDSFWFQMDDLPAYQHLFGDITQVNNPYPEFTEDFLKDFRNAVNPVIIELTEGEHDFSVFLRESGAKLDKFEFVKVN